MLCQKTPKQIDMESGDTCIYSSQNSIVISFVCKTGRSSRLQEEVNQELVGNVTHNIQFALSSPIRHLCSSEVRLSRRKECEPNDSC